MWIITGLGRTGTSYVASFFKRAGILTGFWNEGLKAGYEDVDATRINKMLLSHEFITDQHFEVMRSLSVGIRIAKDPRFMFTLSHWIQAGADIEGVVLCKRNPVNMLASMRKNNVGMLRGWSEMNDISLLGLSEVFTQAFENICDKADIEIIETHYPENTKNYKEIQEVLETVLSSEEALELWNTKKIIDGK